MIPQLYIAGAAALILSVGGFAAGWKVNGWRKDSQEKAVNEAIEKAAKAATESAVTAIEGIQVKYVTIKQQGETITREVPVYRECLHDPRGLQSINQALAGGEPGSGALGVSEPDPAH